MIDVQLLRTEIDAVAKRLATRGYTLDISGFGALEETRRRIQSATEQLQSQRNALAKQVGQAKAKKDEAEAAALMRQGAEFGEKLKHMEADNAAVQEKLREFVSLIPNLPHASVPVGSPSEDAVQQRHWSEPPKFGFPPRDHLDTGTGLCDLAFATPATLPRPLFVHTHAPVSRPHRTI